MFNSTDALTYTICKQKENKEKKSQLGVSVKMSVYPKPFIPSQVSNLQSNEPFIYNMYPADKSKLYMNW